MMKILHVYNPADKHIAHYVSMLTTAMEDAANMNRMAESSKEAASACQEWQPDLIHVHGNTGFPLPQDVRRAVTAHGQKVADSKAYVVTARSPMERQRLEEAGWRRIETVADPIITRTTTPADAARQMKNIYQKVTDSNPRALMDEPTLALLHMLLKAGIGGDRRWVAGQGAAAHHPDAPPPEAWRKILIYAALEGVESIVRKGSRLMEMEAPPTDTATIVTYLPDSYTQPSDAANIPGIAALLNVIEGETSNRQLPLCRIATLHQLLMQPGLDEGKLVQQLDDKRQLLLARLLQLASEETLLDEGFMPLTPINDRQTRQLRTLINRHLEI